MPRTYQPLGVGMTPSKTKLGEFLRARRLELQLRQTEIAERSSVPQSSYSALETGKSQAIKPEYLKGLSEALQCEPWQLQSLIPDKPGPKTEFGRLIWSQRKRLELTPKELARIAKVNLSAIMAIEGDKRLNISYRLIGPLSKALKLDPSVLNKYAGKTMIEKTSNSDLGQLIRSRRKELGLSQTQLAKKIQVTKQFLSQIELGRQLLRRNDTMIELLSAALELDVSELQKVRRIKREE